ncbi:hypothetical protein AAFF_G00125590 [Aldrovandia affinis]|uniref:Uncharacterized protein n=1 Tax=Aldrovandia affinis TaxID=143900 RepID=A0AAD7RRW3_9TELE|nr:hypothetical protein AAFF_G00125590 [Aldrovandia affinis]
MRQTGTSGDPTARVSRQRAYEKSAPSIRATPIRHWRRFECICTGKKVLLHASRVRLSPRAAPYVHGRSPEPTRRSPLCLGPPSCPPSSAVRGGAAPVTRCTATRSLFSLTTGQSGRAAFFSPSRKQVLFKETAVPMRPPALPRCQSCLGASAV